MTLRFDPQHGLIIVPTRLSGPLDDVIIRLALDTGATGSMINWDVAILLGYDPASSGERIRVTTGSGVEYTPRVTIQRIEALGRTCQDFPILCHTLPPSATVDGLLGLDFFRGTILTIDLQVGTLTLEE